jgi:hypothetical protein
MNSMPQGVQPSGPDVWKSLLIFVSLLMLLSGYPKYCLAQAGVVNSDSVTIRFSTDVEQGKPNKARLVTTIAAFSTAYIGSMAYLQYIWYHDHDRVKFEFSMILEDTTRSINSGTLSDHTLKATSGTVH